MRTYSDTGLRAVSVSAMKERFLDWLANLAGDYLRWHYEREIKDMPRCPDCQAPEKYCSCNEDARQDRDFEAAFDAGYARAQEEAWR